MPYQSEEQDINFKGLFIPFTILKAIHYIILIGLLVFGNVLINGFVWDDKTYIINNLAVHTINLPAAFQSSMFNQSGQYRPIPVLYFSTLYSLFNTTSFFYHFIQIVLHITNACLVFLLFKQFFRKHLAFFLALVFLVHPLQAESVAYIGATGNNLYFLFGVLALLLSIKLKKTTSKRLILLGILLLLSLLSKETGGLFLVMLLAYSAFYRGKKLASFSLISVSSLLVYFSLRFFVGNIYFEKLDMVAIARLSFEERLMHIPSVFFYYIKLFFYPDKLAVGQEWVLKEITAQNFYYPLILELIVLTASLVFATYLVKRNAERFKIFLFFSLWLFLGFFLHSQIFPLDWTVADRWFYFPIVGLLGMIGVVLQSINVTKKTTFTICYSIAVLLLVLLSLRTMVRNTNWHDAITLYSHDTKIVDSWDIETNLGYEYKIIDNQPEALKHYLRAIKLFPFESTYLNAGIVYDNMGNHEKAIEYYYKALASKRYPTSDHKHGINTYTNTINSLLVANRTTEAKKIAMDALQDYPDAPELWAELAITQQWLRENDEALNSAEKAVRLESTQFTRYVYDKIRNKQKIKVLPGKNEVKIL